MQQHSVKVLKGYLCNSGAKVHNGLHISKLWLLKYLFSFKPSS